MNTRHKAREAAFQLLYRCDLLEDFGLTPSDIRKHFEHFQVPVSTFEFAQNLVTGTIAKRPALDELIEAHAANWRMSRMALVDRNLLRLGAHELLHFRETPRAVVLDEWVQLAKQYGTSETSAFLNGILDSLAKPSD